MAGMLKKEDEYFKKYRWLEQALACNNDKYSARSPHLVTYVVPITKNKKGKEILKRKKFSWWSSKIKPKCKPNLLKKLIEPFGIN